MEYLQKKKNLEANLKLKVVAKCIFQYFLWNFICKPGFGVRIWTNYINQGLPRNSF